VDHRDSGPPWTGGHGRSRELAGARPPAAPGLESSDRGAGKGEEGPANSMAGSPRLGRRWKGDSPASESSAREATSRALGGLGEGALEVWGASPGAGSAFIVRGRGGGGPSAVNGRIEEASMAGLKTAVSGLEEGEEWRRLMGEMKGN
jgi:hypothetical protein